MITAEEYQEIKQRESQLVSQIKAYEADLVGYRESARATTGLKENAEGRLTLYVNHLSDAVKEYEHAHPPTSP